MTRLEHRAEHATSVHLAQQTNSRIRELFSRLAEHATEVVLLEMLPETLDVVELLRGVGGKPEYSNQALHPCELRQAPLRIVGRAVIENQEDPLSRPLGTSLKQLDQADKQAGVGRFGTMREEEWAIRPSHSSANRDPSIFARGWDSQGFATPPVGVRDYRQEIEPDTVGEPKLVVPFRIESPFFSRFRALWARLVAARFWRFRIVRLVRRHTMPCIRRSSLTHAGVSHTRVSSPMYCASRGAVQRVNAYPNRRGSCSTTRTNRAMYLASASVGRPLLAASLSPKCRRLSQRARQFARVDREMVSRSRICATSIPEASISSAVTRSRSLADWVERRNRWSDAFSDGVSRMENRAGMDCFPSLGLQGEVYHPSTHAMAVSKNLTGPA